MISIIVAVFNCRNTIKKCIQSIQAQSYQEWELLLIDDGSADGSGEICDKIAECDYRIRVYHKENGGVSSARNFGLDKSRGEYILFCDSDDFVETEWCEKLLDVFKSEKNVLPICNYYRYSEGKSLVNKYKLCDSITRFIPIQDFFSLNEPELLGIPWNKIYMNSIIKTNEIKFRENLSLGEDLLFVLDYISHGLDGFVFINEPLYYYSVGDVSRLSNKYYDNLEDIYNIIYKNIKCKLNIYPGVYTRCREMYLRSYFYALNRVFRNIWLSNNPEKTLKKLRHCIHVYHSPQFQKCKKAMKSSEMNYLQYLSLKCNSYILYEGTVVFTEKLSKIMIGIRR